MSRLIRTTSLFRFTPDMDDAGGGGGGANPLDELPEDIRGVVAEKFVPKSVLDTDYLPKKAVEEGYVSKQKHADALNGSKGGLQAQINDLNSKLVTAEQARQALFDQHAALTNEHGALKTKWDEAAPKVEQLSARETELNALKAEREKLQLLLKYPDALDENVTALVTSSALPVDQLETYLKGLAETRALDGKRQTTTPPLPKKKSDGPTSQELFDKAEAHRKKGELVDYRSTMDAYYAKKDEEDGKFIPPHVSREAADAG